MGRFPTAAECPVCRASLPVLTFQGTIPAHFGNSEGAARDPEAHLGVGQAPERSEIIAALGVIRDLADVLNATANSPAAVRTVHEKGEPVLVVPCQVLGLKECALKAAMARDVLERAFPLAKERREGVTGVVVPLFPVPDQDEQPEPPLSGAALKERAKALGIKGRSRMSADELRLAVTQAEGD